MSNATLIPPRYYTVSYLGPAATHSHLFALSLFGPVDQNLFRYQPENNLIDVVQSVSNGKTGWGVVPYFNSQSGPVGRVYPGLLDIEKGLFTNIKISACVSVPISHDLLGTCSPDKINEIRQIYSKKEAYEQCEEFLNSLLPNHEAFYCESTADAARQAKKKGKTAAAIGSKKILLFNPQLKILCPNIQDTERNITQFLVLERNSDNNNSLLNVDSDIKLTESTQQTWIVFTSSLTNSILQKMLNTATKWGLNAAAISGSVVDADQFKMRFLMQLDQSLNSFKVNFFLSEINHLSPVVLGSPIIVSSESSDQMKKFENYLVTQSKNYYSLEADSNESEKSYLLDQLDEMVKNRLKLIPDSAYKLYLHGDISTMESVWEVLGIPPERMLNTQVCEETSELKQAFCCVPGNRKIDTTKVSNYLGGTYRRVPPDRLAQINQNKYAISPLTAPSDATVIIEESIERGIFLFLGSGNLKISVAIDLARCKWPEPENDFPTVLYRSIQKTIN